jgi:hypothetical protein
MRPFLAALCDCSGIILDYLGSKKIGHVLDLDVQLLQLVGFHLDKTWSRERKNPVVPAILANFLQEF